MYIYNNRARLLADAKPASLCLFTEMDYWRSPSKKPFAAKGAEYSDLSRKIEWNRKRLSRKRPSDSVDDDLLEEQLGEQD